MSEKQEGWGDPGPVIRDGSSGWCFLLKWGMVDALWHGRDLWHQGLQSARVNDAGILSHRVGDYRD